MPRFPRMPLHAASGDPLAVINPKTPKSIRFVKYGCTNRPFFHIIVSYQRLEQKIPPIEQLGTYDPIPNQYNEKLVTFNFERILYWMGQGNVTVSKPVEKLLGLAGFLPIHPMSYMKAWRNRRAAEESAKNTTEQAQESQAASIS